MKFALLLPFLALLAPLTGSAGDILIYLGNLKKKDYADGVSPIPLKSDGLQAYFVSDPVNHEFTFIYYGVTRTGEKGYFQSQTFDYGNPNLSSGGFLVLLKVIEESAEMDLQEGHLLEGRVLRPLKTDSAGNLANEPSAFTVTTYLTGTVNATQASVLTGIYGKIFWLKGLTAQVNDAGESANAALRRISLLLQNKGYVDLRSASAAAVEQPGH